MSKVLDVLRGSIKIKVSVKSMANKVIDDVLEPALKKVVDDSSNKFDDMILSSIYPGLEAEVKKKVGEEIDKLKEKIPESVRDMIEFE